MDREDLEYIRKGKLGIEDEESLDEYMTDRKEVRKNFFNKQMSYYKQMGDMQKDLATKSTQEHEDDFDSVVDFCNSLKFPLKVYRGLLWKDKDEVRQDNLGVHWTIDKNFIDRNNFKTVIVGEVNEDDVDWKLTQHTYVYYSANKNYPENEIWLKKNAKPHNIEIYTKDEFKSLEETFVGVKDIPVDVGLGENPEIIDSGYENTTWDYFGNCIDTVDEQEFWDATEMAQALENAVIYTGNKKIINAPKEAQSKNTICGVIEDRDIGFIYNINNDIHYFFNIEQDKEIDYNELITFGVFDKKTLMKVGHSFNNYEDALNYYNSLDNRKHKYALFGWDKKLNRFTLNEKIVKKGNKWQVQSEKGRNLGTYNTKPEAEKRLKQVHYFKHVNEEITANGDFITESIYEAKDKILSYKNDLVRIYIDEKVPVYLIGDAYSTTHLQMIKDANELGYNLGYSYSDPKQLCLLYNPKNNYDFDMQGDAIDDGYLTEYVYDDFSIWSEYDKDFKNFKLSKLLGKIKEELYHDEEYYDNEDTNEDESLKESRESTSFELGTAGYILPNGSFVYMNEYHGEDEKYRSSGHIEFSNTHCEEDTCVRIFKEPNDIQYKKLEEVIDKYLDTEEYCKVEINNDFYKVYSLREDACQDIYQDEIVGNWTGYKLVQIIKNYYKSLNEELEEKVLYHFSRQLKENEILLYHQTSEEKLKEILSSGFIRADVWSQEHIDSWRYGDYAIAFAIDKDKVHKANDTDRIIYRDVPKEDFVSILGMTTRTKTGKDNFRKEFKL